ncbi:MAG: hypothetical protein FWG61_08545 [Firmicutes bacterium]|nr:hypothetical protein [Bacillota bacterium]
MIEKINWSGTILSIQPRTNVWRYRVDNRTHSHTGYNIFLDGVANSIPLQYAVAISEKQQQSIAFRIGDEASGTGWTKKYPQWEYADYYRAGALKRIKPNTTPADERNAPPWTGDAPDMATYEWRGCRVLSKACWKGKCFKCKWAAMANVTIEYDWGVKQKWRFESFCYGPKSCKYYKRGADPMIPYKNDGSNPDSHGGFDEICTENRDWDE